jgi:peptidoglycan/LPS O-acetylase OafA/YrhL
MLGNNNFKWHHYQSIVEQVGYTLNAVLWAGLIGYSLGMPAARSTHFLSLPFMRRIGRYSYGMYLFHLPVGILVNKLVARYMFLNGNWNWLQQLFFIVLSFALTFVLGMVSYHVYENRFLRMKARIGVKGVAN